MAKHNRSFLISTTASLSELKKQLAGPEVKEIKDITNLMALKPRPHGCPTLARIVRKPGAA